MINDVLQYIKLILAYKNCEIDLMIFEKPKLMTGNYLPWLIEEVTEVLQKDMRAYKSNNMTIKSSAPTVTSAFLPLLVEGVMEVLKEDMKAYRGIRITVERESDTTRIYHWKYRANSGSIRLNTRQLMKLTTDTCEKYFNDSRVVVKSKAWY